jgi:hypothetical protein
VKDVTEPRPDPITGKPSFVRAMAAQFADMRPFDGFEQWEWDWLRADLSFAQIEEGLTQAFEYGPAPFHSLVFNILEAARSRVEDGLPPYGDLWAPAHARRNASRSKRSAWRDTISKACGSLQRVHFCPALANKQLHTMKQDTSLPDKAWF